MPATQITIVLNHHESEALREAAMAALRRPKDQARILLRQCLGLTNEGRPIEDRDALASGLEGAYAIGSER
jgi:hypothetical protein